MFFNKKFTTLRIGVKIPRKKQHPVKNDNLFFPGKY